MMPPAEVAQARAKGSIRAIAYKGSYLETRWDDDGTEARYHNERVRRILERLPESARKGAEVLHVADLEKMTDEKIGRLRDAIVLVDDDRVAWDDAGNPAKKPLGALVGRLRKAQGAHVQLICSEDILPKGMAAELVDAPSIFDISFERDSKIVNRMENAFEIAIKEVLSRLEGLYLSDHVKFDSIKQGTRKLSEREDIRCLWRGPGYVEFDYVVYDEHNRIVAAIEIDGSVHRYKYEEDASGSSSSPRWKRFAFPESEGELAEKDRNALLDTCKNDIRKDRFAVDKLGAAPVRLSTDSAYTPASLLFMRMQLHDIQPVVWIRSAEEIPKDAPFIYMRISTDGSTYGEIDELCELIGRQAKLMTSQRKGVRYLTLSAT